MLYIYTLIMDLIHDQHLQLRRKESSRGKTLGENVRGKRLQVKCRINSPLTSLHNEEIHRYKENENNRGKPFYKIKNDENFFNFLLPLSSLHHQKENKNNRGKPFYK